MCELSVQKPGRDGRSFSPSIKNEGAEEAKGGVGLEQLGASSATKYDVRGPFGRLQQGI